MNLLVIATLVIGIIGIYAQVLSIQTARLFAHQSGVAQAMINWQAAAVSMAISIVKTNPAYVGAPCSLTWNSLPITLISSYPHCPSPLNAGLPIDPPAGPLALGGTITDNSFPANLNLIYDTTHNVTQCAHLPSTCVTPLPGGGCSQCNSLYDVTDHQFFSLLFNQGGNNYVVTLVTAPIISTKNPAPGYVNLASYPKGSGAGVVVLPITLTSVDFMRQLKHSTAPPFSYGYVNAAYQLTTTTPQLTLPPFLNANGAIALIGSTGGF